VLLAHSAKTLVFPHPVGAHTNAILAPNPALRTSTSRGRETNSARGAGTSSFVRTGTKRGSPSSTSVYIIHISATAQTVKPRDPLRANATDDLQKGRAVGRHRWRPNGGHQRHNQQTWIAAHT
jgi:hypothetical protein